MLRLNLLNRPFVDLTKAERAIKTIKSIHNPKLNLTHISWEQLTNDGRAVYEAQEDLIASRDNETLTEEDLVVIEAYIDLSSNIVAQYDCEFVRRKWNG